VTSKAINDFRALLQQQKAPERVVAICLRADLTAEIEQLEERLRARRETVVTATLSGDAEAREIANQIRALEEQAKDATVQIRMRALPRKQWADLVAKHPPVDDSTEFNVKTIFDDAVPACIVEPELDRDTLDQFLDRLTQGQWDQLAGTCFALNAGDGRVPFSGLASLALLNSDETSKPPEPTG
jgi:hypothetical protein